MRQVVAGASIVGFQPETAQVRRERRPKPTTLAGQRNGRHRPLRRHSEGIGNIGPPTGWLRIGSVTMGEREEEVR
jgi:hypothetical protein